MQQTYTHSHVGEKKCSPASQWLVKSEQHCLNFTQSASQLHHRPLLNVSPHRPLHEFSVAQHTQRHRKHLQQNGHHFLVLTWNMHSVSHNLATSAKMVNRLTCYFFSSLMRFVYRGDKKKKSLTCGALIFVVLAAFSVRQAVIITLARVASGVLGTASPFAACCFKEKRKEKIRKTKQNKKSQKFL